MKKYLGLLGRKIDQILRQNGSAKNLQSKCTSGHSHSSKCGKMRHRSFADRFSVGGMLYTGMATRLWNYVATFSNLSGNKLAEIYKKLNEDPEVAVMSNGVPTAATSGDSYLDLSSAPQHYLPSNNEVSKATPTVRSSLRNPRGDAEAWKRRRREGESSSHERYPVERLHMERGKDVGQCDSEGRDVRNVERVTQCRSDIQRGRHDSAVRGQSVRMMPRDTSNHGRDYHFHHSFPN